jgi:hypothetical protein
MCRKTPDGIYLVPFTAEGVVREVDREGKVIREFPRRPLPGCALRLEDGATLIGADRVVTEYDREDRKVRPLTDARIGKVLQCQLLTPALTPRTDAIVR